MRQARWARGVGLALLVPAAVVVPAGTAHAEDVDCTTLFAGYAPVHADRDSLPRTELGMDEVDRELARRGIVAGEGVGVAVVDSGVVPDAGIPVSEHVDVTGHPEVVSYHGTAVAGLIAGAAADGRAVGFAPGARILDVKVYDADGADPARDEVPVLGRYVAAGLREVLERVDRLDIKVVTIALNVPDDAAVERLIGKLWRRGVVTVAASGNRPTESSDPLHDRYSDPRPGENAAPDVHPASYPHVVGAGSTVQGAEGADPTDPTRYVVQSSAIDVAVPTAGGVTYAWTGGTCVLTDPATSWSAAEVSGVLAMLQSARPESAERLVSRLRLTASGQPDVPDLLVGAGVVQPFEALTRPLVLAADGSLADPPPGRPTEALSAPEPEPDLLASTRHDAVWWGLCGGGALLLALLMRPVLARRRR